MCQESSLSVLRSTIALYLLIEEALFVDNGSGPCLATLTGDEELGLDDFIKRGGSGTSITVTEDSTGKEMKILLERQPVVVR